MNDIYITLYRTIKSNGENTADYRYITLQKACERIKTGDSINQRTKKTVREIVEKYRTTKQKEVKLDLPAYVFSGKYSARNMEHCTEYSGLLMIDFDDVPNYDFVWKQITQDKFTFVAFRSPSGTGIKLLVRVAKDINLHRRYFQAAGDYYDQFHKVDRSGIDLARACFDSYDPNIFVNLNCETWTEVADLTTYPARAKDSDYNFKLPLLTVRDDNTKYQKAVEWTNRYHSFTSGNRNNYIFRLAFLCNRLGVSEAYTVYAICADYTSSDFPDTEIRTAVKSAYNKRSVHGEITLKDWTSYNIIKERKQEGTSREEIISEICAANNIDEDHDKEFTELTKQAIDEFEQETNSTFQYWWTVTPKESDPDQTVLQFDYKRLHNWLKHTGGVFRYRANSNSDWTLIKSDNNNVVREITPNEVVTVLTGALRALPDYADGYSKDALYNFTMNKIDPALSEKKIMAIEEKQIDFFRDTKTESYFFYENCVYRVTGDSIKPLDPLNEVNRSIWADQRAPHKMVIEESNGDDISKYFYMGDNFQFGEWIYLLCEREFMSPKEVEERAKNLCAIIGYNLHRYKDPTNPRATILTEFFQDGRPNGGTGKSLLVHAIGQVRKMVQEDGKNFNFNSTFAFQQITPDTNLVVFNDIRQGFPFERLFMAITDGVIVEPKHKSKITLPFADSPKFMNTTNYPVTGTGDSFNRRMYIFEVTQDFKAKYGNPYEKYGRRFFDDWTDADWGLFYKFMMKCTQHYLKYGVQVTVSENYKLFQFKQFLGTETVFDYLTEQVPINEEFSKKDFNDAALFEFRDSFSYKLTPNKIGRWLSEYAVYLGGELTQERKWNNGKTEVMAKISVKHFENDKKNSNENSKDFEQNSKETVRNPESGEDFVF